MSGDQNILRRSLCSEGPAHGTGLASDRRGPLGGRSGEVSLTKGLGAGRPEGHEGTITGLSWGGAAGQKAGVTGAGRGRRTEGRARLVKDGMSFISSKERPLEGACQGGVHSFPPSLWASPEQMGAAAAQVPGSPGGSLAGVALPLPPFTIPPGSPSCIPPAPSLHPGSAPSPSAGRPVIPISPRPPARPARGERGAPCLHTSPSCDEHAQPVPTPNHSARSSARPHPPPGAHSPSLFWGEARAVYPGGKLLGCRH